MNRQIEEVAALSEQRAGQGLATEQLHRRRDVLQRHAASLNPLRRRLYVNAIQVTLHSGKILTHRCAPDISTALASHWGPVFTAQPVDTEGGLRYAHTHLASGTSRLYGRSISLILYLFCGEHGLLLRGLTASVMVSGAVQVITRQRHCGLLIRS